MIPLILQIENIEERRAQSWAFHRSPVRIGRHPFNSLRLKQEYVSQWHAVVRFHTEKTTYLDLGSTNPTLIDGVAIDPNVEVEVTDARDVRIGNLRFHFIRDPNPPPEIPTAPSAHASLMEGTAAVGSQKTVSLPSYRPAPMGAPSPAQRAAPELRSPVTTGATTAAMYQRWRADFAELLVALQRELSSAPEAERRGRVHDQLRLFPELAYEERYRAALTALQLESLLPLDPATWLRARIGGFFALRENEVPRVFERAGQLLDMFAEAFIATRREHERMSGELRLERHAEQSLLQRTDNGQTVLAYLLNPQVGAERLDELTRVFTDFAMHQVAVLSGAIEGARAILHRLSPTELEKAKAPPANALALEQEGHWQRLVPHPSRSLWRKYLHRHHDLIEGDQFARELFGPDFARRYYALVSATGDGSAPPSERD